MRIMGAGVKLKQRSVQTVVVYDSADGRIVHTHHVVVLEGANAPPAKKVEQAALMLAEKAGNDRSKMTILNLGSRSMDRRYRYRVDLKKRSLVRVQTIGKTSRRRPAIRFPE
jgi:hypothetical protein